MHLGSTETQDSQCYVSYHCSPLSHRCQNSAAFSVRFEVTVEGTRDCVPPNSGYVPLDLAPEWHLLYKRALLRKRLQTQHVRNHRLISELSVLTQVIPSKINQTPELCSDSSFRVNIKRTHLLGRDLLAMNQELNQNSLILKLETHLKMCRNRAP